MQDLTLGFSLDSRGLDVAFSALEGRLSDLTPALDKAAPSMIYSIACNFAAQGRPVKWPSLAPSTVERKGRSIILYETGRLMSSIICETGPDFLRLMAPVPYARVQQEGGQAGVDKAAIIPARPFLLFQEEDVSLIIKGVREYIAGPGLRGF